MAVKLNYRRGFVSRVFKAVSLVTDDEVKINLLDFVERSEKHFVRDDHYSADSLFQKLDWPILLTRELRY